MDSRPETESEIGKFPGSTIRSNSSLFYNLSSSQKRTSYTIFAFFAFVLHLASFLTIALINKNKNRVIPVILYIAGCFIMIFSLSFLVNLNTQILSLNNKKRKVVVVLFLLLTLSILYALIQLSDNERIPIYLSCLALQYVCYFWYSMTYLPINRKRTSQIMDSLLPI